MADQKEQRAPRAGRRPTWVGRLLPLFGVSGVLLAMVFAYMGYDYVSLRASPCETIFRQSTLGLSTKIGFLKTEGEVKIGREAVQELSERAQMTALNLKTCCTVLDAGRLNPEQFLQCKSKARAYESKLGEIVAAFDQRRALAGDRHTPATSTVRARPVSGGAVAESGPKVVAAEPLSRISNDIEAARRISQSFNREVVEVSTAQALRTLELSRPKHVKVSANEQEPNDDALSTNVIRLGEWVAAALSDGKDQDYFSFRTPQKHRDWIKVELDNRSTTMEPRIYLYDADKKQLGNRYNTTPGANLSYAFVSAPDRRYAVRISNYHGSSKGAYLLRVTPNKAYDALEPNDSILAAKDIDAGKEISAAIMDGADQDFFRIEAPAKTAKVRIKLTNASSTLHPRIYVYGASKALIGTRYSTTAGADLEYNEAVAGQNVVYVRVADYHGFAAGDYRLKVEFDRGQ